MKPGNRQQDCTVLNPVGVNLEMRDDSLLLLHTPVSEVFLFLLSQHKKEER